MLLRSNRKRLLEYSYPLVAPETLIQATKVNNKKNQCIYHNFRSAYKMRERQREDMQDIKNIQSLVASLNMQQCRHLEQLLYGEMNPAHTRLIWETEKRKPISQMHHRWQVMDSQLNKKRYDPLHEWSVHSKRKKVHDLNYICVTFMIKAPPKLQCNSWSFISMYTPAHSLTWGFTDAISIKAMSIIA